MTDVVSFRSLAFRPLSRALSELAVRRDYVVDLTIVCILNALVRLPWVLIVHPGLVWDSTFCYLGAKSIAAGHGYSILGHPTAFFPVGWPAFLAGVFLITGPSVAVIAPVNVILWALTSVLVYLLVERLGGRAVGLVTAS
jgi:hypothetical protein